MATLVVMLATRRQAERAIGLAMGLCLLSPAVASAHEASAAGRSMPLVVLLTAAVVYTLSVLRARRRVTWTELAAAAGAASAIAIALLSPLERAAGKLFSAHMAQHSILTLVAAPLLAWTRPLAHVAAAFPRARPVLRRPPSAIVAWAAHGLVLWAWHLPPLYELALARPWLHAAEHAMLLGTGVLFWWSVSRSPAQLTGVVYVFGTAGHTAALGALIALAPRPWFPSHGVPGLPALEDQQLAGLLMWVPAGVLLTGIALGQLAAWLRQADRRMPALGSRGGRVSTLVAIALVTTGLAGCNAAAPTAAAMTGGDPERGRAAARRYGCQTCHTIPGVPGAIATIGPPLSGLATRGYVGGRPNAPAQLQEWIRHPQQVRPASPMPEMGVSEQDARDIAAYLYTLR